MPPIERLAAIALILEIPGKLVTVTKLEGGERGLLLEVAFTAVRPPDSEVASTVAVVLHMYLLLKPMLD